jgi:CubicO group peptidase (beta-lactamase class C family)
VIGPAGLVPRRLGVRPIVGIAMAFVALTSISARRALSQSGGYAAGGDVGRVAATLDSTLRAELRRHSVHGAVIAVVHGGRVILSRGYGVADTLGTPVDPNLTVFGVSSMSKVFTTIAVLQLVDRGLIALDIPVSRYVDDVPLDADDSSAVTVAHLLTHSGGFDEANIGIAARTPDAIIPLAEYLRRAMPPRVRPAGEVTSYSNHGFALAGLIVERVAKRPFSAHVRATIFDSLGMTRTGFEQPLSADLERTRALPLRRTRDAWSIVPRIYFNDAPASALFTTAGDMSRFMIDFLDTGGNRRLLSDSSFERMLTPQFRNHPAVTGLTFGFRERRDGATRSIEQGGDWQDYSSDLLLAPDLGLGLFLAMSNDAADRIAPLLWQHVLDVAAPSATTTIASVLPRLVPAADFSRTPGNYRVNRYSRHTLARLGVLTGAIRHERIERVDSTLRGAGGSLSSAGPDVYVRDRTRSLVAFRFPEDGGPATHLFFENSPYAAYERVPWFGDSRVHLAAFALCMAAFIATLASIRRRNGTAGAVAWRSNVHRRVAALTAVLALSFIILTGALLATVDVWEFQYGVPMRVRVALLLAIPIALLSATSIVTCLLVVLGREGSMAWRVRCIAQMATAVLFVTLLSYWRLL